MVIARSIATIALRTLFVWLMVWFWNPFHFDSPQRWWVAIVLWSLDTTQSMVYHIKND